MKLDIIDSKKQKVGQMDLPIQFSEEVRPDLIKKAVLAFQSNQRQPYGAKPEAGMRHNARLSKRRREYRGSYGFGISRTPRKILSRRGRRMFWVGAVAPNTVGGRRAHPPKAQTIVAHKINVKERRKAIRSCIAATIQSKYTKERGHRVPEMYPFIVNDSFEKMSKTKDVLAALHEMGFETELERTAERTIRAGKGTMRGRKYKSKVGPLIVVTEQSPIASSAKNIPGVDIITVKSLNANILAPGAVPGRLTIWTKAAIEQLQKDKLFM